MTTASLSPYVVSSILRILGAQENALDDISADFNVVDILNEYFPDEASLTQIDDVNAQLAQIQLTMQCEVAQLSRELTDNQNPERMGMIQEMISELLGQMSRIREKASESEAVVRDITKDIQVLDMVKRNLTLSMTTMKRLQMLVSALRQLEDFSKEKKYREVAQSLSAVIQISASFSSYAAVPRVSSIRKRIQQIQGELLSQLDQDFDAFYLQDTSKQSKPSLIAEACLVVDVLGPEARAQAINRYVALELKEYRRIFRVVDEAGQLDNIPRRFAWFRRMLHIHESEHGRVFPVDWKMDWHLVSKFMDITRDDLVHLLAKAAPGLTVKVLLELIQLTAEFELSLAQKWATPVVDILKATTMRGAEAPKPISSAFIPHLNIFVDAQDKVIADMLAPHRRKKGTKAVPRSSVEESVTSGKGGDNMESALQVVLPSSPELFYFYAQSLENCEKLSTGQALYDLSAVHRKWLKIYAEEVLVAKRQSTKSAETKIDGDTLKQLCLIINTAHYCQATALELEEKLRQRVDDEFKDKICFQVERDLFVGAISASINALILEFERTCEPALQTLARTTWVSMNRVSGPSPWSGELVAVAGEMVATVKLWMEEKKYLRNFMDKASSALLAMFTAALVRSRPLGETGGEQLLIDLQVLKAFLAKMPGEEGQAHAATYARTLAKTTARVEALLKVIVTPVDSPEGFILNYTILVGDASFSNFQKILDLKGTPKSAQNALLDTFLTTTSAKADLASTSFLSSLDMDPRTLGAGASAGSGIGAEAAFVGLGMSLSASGPPTGSGMAPAPAEQKREVFSDFRRFVSFGLRKETMPP